MIAKLVYSKEAVGKAYDTYNYVCIKLHTMRPDSIYGIISETKTPKGITNNGE